MVFKASFNQQEIEQLYLTYLRNTPNYLEIKRRLFGDTAKIAFRKNLKGRFYFMISLTVVAIASSFFSIFAEHWASLGAIWIIWAGFMIGLGIAMYVSYKDAFLVLIKNEKFFEDFEKIASKCNSLEDFIIDWNQRTKKELTHPVP